VKELRIEPKPKKLAGEGGIGAGGGSLRKSHCSSESPRGLP